jgi:predicted SnoaL-like aldol condensation-catalyzing enzyme
MCLVLCLGALDAGGEDIFDVPLGPIAGRSVLGAAAGAAFLAVGQACAQETASPAASPTVAGTPVALLSENKQKAIAVLQSLASGDPTAFQTYVAETSIQHHLGVPTGRQAIIDALPSFVEQGAKVAIRRVIEDGDRVALHAEYDFAGPMIGFDVFRVEDGKIVEHRDVLQTIPPQDQWQNENGKF